MIMGQPNKNGQNQKVFERRDETHTHTLVHNEESTAIKWMMQSKMGSSKCAVCRHAKPSHTNLYKISENLINVVLATFSFVLYQIERALQPRKHLKSNFVRSSELIQTKLCLVAYIL